MPTVADDIQDFIDQARNIAGIEQTNADGFAAKAVAAVDAIRPTEVGFSIVYSPSSGLKDIEIPKVPDIKVNLDDYESIKNDIQGYIVGQLASFMASNFPNEQGYYATAVGNLNAIATNGIAAGNALLARLTSNSGAEGHAYLKGRFALGANAQRYVDERFDAGRAAGSFMGGKYDDGGSAAAFLVGRFAAGDAAATELIDMLTSGGTALPAAVEDMVWQRDRARLLKDASRAERQTIDGFAARGFPLPPGSMVGVLEMAQAETTDKVAAQSRDVAIKQIDVLIGNIREAAQIAASGAIEAGRTVLSDATSAGTVTLQDAQAAARLTYEDAIQAARILVEDSLASMRAVVESASQAAAAVVSQRNGAIEASVGYIRALVSSFDGASSAAGALAQARVSALNAGSSYYSAQASAANAFNNGFVALERLKLDAQIAPAQLSVQQNDGYNRSLIGIAQARSQAALGAAEAVSHIAAAAMSSLNAIVSHQQSSTS